VTFTTEAFDEHQHNTSSFECGKPELDMWLRSSAQHAERNRTSRTFVWHAGDSVVVAYYSLAAHLLTRQDIGRIGRGSPSEIPAVLLARLALTASLHRQHLGSVLLADALRRAVEAGQHLGARFVAVDAIDDDAANFYIKHGFTPVPEDSHRLVRKMSSVASDFDD
jgi:GNAT superfamily N-acetyltransferase